MCRAEKPFRPADLKQDSSTAKPQRRVRRRRIARARSSVPVRPVVDAWRGATQQLVEVWYQPKFPNRRHMRGGSAHSGTGIRSAA